VHIYLSGPNGTYFALIAFCAYSLAYPGAYLRRNYPGLKKQHLLHLLSLILLISTYIVNFRLTDALILLLDGVDSVLDPLVPEAEEIYAMIEEFGNYEHICLVTTSRVYPVWGLATLTQILIPRGLSHAVPTHSACGAFSELNFCGLQHTTPN
jgi:hypothetical protein